MSNWSIPPSIRHLSFRARSLGSSLSRDAQLSLSPDTSSSSFRGILRCSQASRVASSLQLVLGRPRGLLPVGHAWKTSLGRRPGGVRYTCPSHLSGLHSELLPISQGVSHHTEETHFGRLYPRSCSFCDRQDI